MYIKYGPCKEVRLRLRILKNTDPFGGIPKDEVFLDVP